MKASCSKGLLFSFVTIFVFTQISYSQLPQFIREKIEINIKSDYCEITGYYYFRNTKSTSIKRTLFYPIPKDSTILYLDTIEVIDVEKNKTISFVHSKSGIHFPIEIQPGKTVLYKVYYSQKTTNNRIEYILTTTQKWGKSLEKADFIIKLPKKLELKFLSYEYDKIEEVNNCFIYKIHKENFMPNKNLVVEWAGRSK